MPAFAYLKPVVAIDGPSGSGKSSVSRGVARLLHLRYLDTGAQYRAMTWWMLKHGIDVTSPTAVAEVCGEPQIGSGTDPDAPAIVVDGTDVADAIRTPEVTAAVSVVSAVPEVRHRLIELQREIIGDGGIVVEGRDIAAVVAPDAPIKVFLTASPEARAERRNAELTSAESLGSTLASIARRDAADSRTTTPLEAAPGAVEIDATSLTLEQVIECVADLALGAPSHR